MITGSHLEWLICMLNSKLFESIFKKFYSVMLGTEGIRWLRQCIVNIPIIPPDQEHEKKMIKLLNKKDYEAIEQEIIQLYSFTEKEVECLLK